MGKRKPAVVLTSSEDDEVRHRSASRNRGSRKSRSIPLSTSPKRTCGGRRSREGDGVGSVSRRSPRSEAAKFAMLSEDFGDCLENWHLTRGNRCWKEPWIDKYIPSSVAKLAVNKKKVEEVKCWLEDRLITSKGRSGNVLLLTGRAGVGKSATVHAIACQLGAQLCEWTTPTPTLWQEHVHISNLVAGSESIVLCKKFARNPLKMDAPERVLSQAHGQARAVVDFLHENVLDFVSDGATNDAWMVSSYLSDADCLLTLCPRTSSSQTLMDLHESQSILQSVAASVATRGVLFGNTQPMSSRWHAIRSPKLWQIEHLAHQHKNQLMNAKCDTYGIGVSMSEIVTEYLPSIKWLGSRITDGLGQGKQELHPITITGSSEQRCVDDPKKSITHEESDEIEDC